MTSRWSSIAVCLLWAITMGWLIAEKVLPPLMLGEPPSYRAIAYARSDQATIGWNVLVNDKRVGSAVSTAVKTAEGSTEIQSHVHFDYLPVEEMAPRGLRALVGPVIARAGGPRADGLPEHAHRRPGGPLDKLPLGAGHAVGPQRRAT